MIKKKKMFYYKLRGDILSLLWYRMKFLYQSKFIEVKEEKRKVKDERKVFS